MSSRTKDSLLLLILITLSSINNKLLFRATKATRKLFGAIKATRKPNTAVCLNKLFPIIVVARIALYIISFG